MKKWTTAAFTLAASTLLGATSHAEDLKVGVLYPITGGGAVYGVPAMEGHRMAVEEVNAAGGINGMTVVSVERDTKLNPAEAAAAAKEMITKDGVKVIIGGPLEVFTRRQLKGTVEIPRSTQILLVPKVANARVSGLIGSADFRSAVGRCIIRDNNFKIHVCLRQKRI